ncbi:hypothetical protein J7M02_05525 [Candidatus Aerophobetes bacterium]|nr:hypothetical protein [Candidatus Aerophobetes bacterium]
MPFSVAAGELMKAAVHNGYLYRIPSCFRINKAIATCNFISKFTNGSFNNIVSSWKLRMLETCLDEFHF